METRESSPSYDQLLAQNRELKARIAEKESSPSYDQLLAQNRELETQIIYLKAQLADLRRQIFGQKRERFVPKDDHQIELPLGLEERQAALPETEEISYKRRRASRKVSPHARQPLPDHLPRKEIRIDPEEDISGLQKIGEEITEELEYKPGKLWVNRFIRPKYARPNGDGVAIGRLPSRPIEKGIAGPGLLANVLIDKFVDALPLYRQRRRYRRLGMDIPDSTLGGWVAGCYELLIPLYDCLRERIVRRTYLMADETPIKVLDPHIRGKAHRGYFWVYYDPVGREAFFDYREGRGRDGPDEVLADFSGYLQADGHNGYDNVIERDGVTGLGCFAHARRYFDKAKESSPKQAQWMLGTLQDLYGIERVARKEQLSFEERRLLREEKSRPILTTIKEWLDEQVRERLFLPKSQVGKAIGYMLNQWPRLENYLRDGRLEIDNNLVENVIRPVAIGRKNYLFCGSHEGAKRAALVYSLVTTAKLQDVEPFAYMRDILSRIADYPHQQIADLLPTNWQTKFKS